jgi:Flp pilus assembly protein TadG
MFMRFLKNIRGNVAPIFAIASIPLITATGAAVDYSSAYRQRTVVQDALDAAALAGGKKIGVVSNDLAKAEAQNFFASNISNLVTPAPTVTPDISGSTITLSTTLEVPTKFLGLLGIDDLTFSLKSQVTQGIGTVEVVLVLDTSGSMYGSKLTSLKTAANNLVTTLFNLASTSTKPDPVKVAVVPFSGAVNVGASHKNDGWIDTGGIGTYHADSMKTYGAASTTNNFTLFSGLKDSSNNAISWGGCVEQRPMPYDAQDNVPTTTTPATMFVPMFAVDEPDNWTCTTSNCSYNGSGSARRFNGSPSGGQSYNNYLPDAGTSTTCGSTNSANTAYWTCANGTANCNGSNNGKSETVAFAGSNISTSLMCKYGTSATKATVTNITFGSGATAVPGGPNFLCNSTAITPLTTTKATVTTAINNLVALGATSIDAGLAWGWRVLSPTTPFTEGRAYDADGNKKIIILMTDGENTYYPNSKVIKSWYGDWGYIFKNHIGSTSTTASVLTGLMNDRTKLACANAKAAPNNVVIYTVGFDINAGTVSNPSAALDLLQTCASDLSKYFNASDSAALSAAFTAIGNSITELRIAE